ncbi:MAG: hypothetical protein R3D98_10435 [Candidatus Krumholzibacteriia bacterium]
MIRTGLLLCLTLGVLTLCSCATVNLDTRSLAQPVQMNTGNEPGYTVIKSFTVNDKAGWVLIIPANQPAGDDQEYLAEILRREIAAAGGDAAINVRVRVQSQPLDYLTMIGTLGFYTTRTVTVTGDIIKFN